MNLSRSTGKRKMSSFTLSRSLIVLIGFLVFVMVIFALYVRSADSGYRKSEINAMRIAKDKGGLTEIDEVSKHTWQETVWVVSGKDSSGEKWMIFERSGEIVSKKVNENMSKERMLAKFSKEHNETPIRMIPGWFNNEPVWEIRYLDEKSKDYQSLDFYSFYDGSMLKTYVFSS